MKTKRIDSSYKILIVSLFCTVFLCSLQSRGQCQNGRVQLAISNVTATATTIDFDVSVKSTGLSLLLFSAYLGNIIYDNQLLPAGATGSFSVITQPSQTGNFPFLYNLTNVNHLPATRQLTWTQLPTPVGTGSTVFLPPNTELKFARFRFSSSLPWTATNSVSLRFATDDLEQLRKNRVVAFCEPYSISTDLTAGTNSLVFVNSNFSISSVLAANQFEGHLSLVAHPNPFTDKFLLSAQFDSSDPVTVIIYDMLGKVVEHQHIFDSGFREYEWGTVLQSGLYNVFVTQGNQSQSVKVCKK